MRNLNTYLGRSQICYSACMKVRPCVIVVPDGVIGHALLCPQQFGRRQNLRPKQVLHMRRLYMGSDVWWAQQSCTRCTRSSRGRCCSSDGSMGMCGSQAVSWEGR